MNHEKVAILVDSGSDVPAELLERYHIFMIPLKILFHEAEYLDGLTIDAGEVYRRLPTEVPKTSLPDGGLITSVLDRIYQEGYRKVLAICISGHLSGTCNLLRLLCDEYEGLECCVLDSKNISIGSGILAIAALKLGAAVAEGVDIDPVAVRTAGENAALNGVQDKLTVLVGDLSDKASGKYDIITANIVANAILSLAPAVPGLMAEGATFIASGIIDSRKDEVIAGLEKAGLAVVEVKEKRGWECIVCKKA